MKLLIKNIKGLVGAREEAPGVLKGAKMKDLPVIEDAWLAVEDGVIADFGEMKIGPESRIGAISRCWMLMGSTCCQGM